MIKDEEWEAIFCTKIEKLTNYATKLATYYENKLNEKERLTKPTKEAQAPPS